MNKPLSILLAVVVFAANTYCACATRMQANARTADAPAEKPHSHCHPAPSEACGACHDDTPGEQDHQSHTCGHCTGTVTADTAKAKTTLPSLDLLPALFANAAANYSVSGGSLRGGTFAHSGLPPPLPPPTLFNLSCCLNN